MMDSRNLTRAELRDIRVLVRKSCANYDRHNKVCPLLDDYSCYMLHVRSAHGGLCRYFQTAVLPLDPSLSARFQRTSTKPCRECGRAFFINGNQSYCSEKCRRNGIRRDTAARVRKYRERARVNVTISLI